MTVAIKYNIGDKHRHWTILGEAKGPKKKRYVTAKCDCGFETVMLLTLVRNGKSKYCRVCVKKRFDDYEYKQAKPKYGNLTVIKQRRGSCQFKNVLVRCTCGTEYWVSLSSLDQENTTSCELCGKNAHNAPRGKRRLVRKKTKSFTALKMRDAGKCHATVLCVYYRSCGDKLFECDCRGWSDENRAGILAEWA